MHSSRRDTSGFSLVEMMVALVAGMIVATALVAFMLSSMKSNGEYVQSTRLTQELRNTLDLATRDLNRAGYNDTALQFVALPSTSPFSPVFIKDEGSTVTPGVNTTYVNADTDGCVIYAYDRSYPNGTEDDPDLADNRPGKLDQANGEIRGLRRFVNADGVGVIEYAESTEDVLPDCDGDSADYTVNPTVCNDDSGWCALSDPTQVDVSRFLIIDKSADIGNVMRVRDLGLFLEGRITGSNEYTRAVSSNVKIRADCISSDVDNCLDAPTPDAPPP